MAAKLAKVRGISKELAGLIMENRESEGPIKSWDEVAGLQQKAEQRQRNKHRKVGSGEDQQPRANGATTKVSQLRPFPLYSVKPSGETATCGNARRI